MYQRILVPIDGSITGEQALQEAIRLSTDKTKLRLVYVLEEIYPLDAEGFAYIDHTALFQAMRQTGERTLVKAAEVVKQSSASVETTLLETSGERVASVINHEAENWSADLIIIGTHGRSGLNRLLLGSVAEGVVREATRPVLLIRSE